MGSSGGGPFLLVYTYDSVLNDIYSCYSSSIYLLIYVATYFVGAERVTNPMWQVFYVGINPEGNSSFLTATTSYFSSACQLVPYQDLEMLKR